MVEQWKTVVNKLPSQYAYYNIISPANIIKDKIKEILKNISNIFFI